MPPQDTPSELRLNVVREGILDCTPATDSAQRAALCSMAWGLSMMFGGDWVGVQDYLPGLHLDIRALGSTEPVQPGPVPQPDPVRRKVLGWDRVDRSLWNALQSTWPTGALVVADEELQCVLREAGLAHGELTVAFTLRCVWPGVLSGRA